MQCFNFAHEQMLAIQGRTDFYNDISYNIGKYAPLVPWCCWLGGRKGTQLVKNWVVGCWHGYLCRARCRFAYGPADVTATHCLLLQ